MTPRTPKEQPASATIVNCWNSIGVWGKERPRCPLLEQVIHCRNCEKFVAAGQSVLERPLPKPYLQEWTRRLAREKSSEPAYALSVVIFRVGGEWFSLSVQHLEHIETRRVIHSIPHALSPLIKGVVNIAGEVQLCFSLGVLLDVEKSLLGDAVQRTAVYEGLVVLKKAKKSYIFPVTEVRELARISLGNIKVPPATMSTVAAGYLLGIFNHGGLNVGHLDADLVIAGFERGVLSSA